jgi:starvation-inducible outer membrane lipoprotein
VRRRTFATGEFLKGADVKSIASYIGDLETTTSQYYISVKSNVRIGGKIMNVAPLPHLVKASGQNG